MITHKKKKPSMWELSDSYYRNDAESRAIRKREDKKKLRRVVRRLINAEVVEAFKGSRMADEHEAIERELASARRAFNKMVDKL